MGKSIIWFSLLLVAFVILTCFNITSVSAQAVDPPEGIHLTWQSNDTAHTITPDQVNGIDVHLDKVNEKALDHILFTLSHNELLLEDILEAPAISDPSL